jgi:hypothetical protein
VGFFLSQVPTKEQVDALSKELLARSTVPGILSTSADLVPGAAALFSQSTMFAIFQKSSQKSCM